MDGEAGWFSPEILVICSGLLGMLRRQGRRGDLSFGDMLYHS